MCLASQTKTSLRDLLLPLGVRGFDRDVYVILAGYIDESMSGEHPPLTFGLSCVFAYGSEWTWAELAWKKVLEDKTRDLIRSGRMPIKRFHAVDLNNFAEDFEDWDGAERTEFTSELIKRVFARHELFSTGYTVSLQDVAEIWPEYRGNEVSCAYYILTKFVMMSVAAAVQKLFTPGTKITLIYERCDYGHVMQAAFDSAISDQKFGLGDIFTTIAPMGWEDCTPLQPADFLAYELMKESHRLKPEVIARKERGRRGSLSALLDSPNFFGDGRNVSRQNLLNLREGINKKSAAIISAPTE